MTPRHPLLPPGGARTLLGLGPVPPEPPPTLEATVSQPEQLTRVAHLQEMVGALRSRMLVCESDQNFAVMARVRRELLAELDDLGAGSQPGDGTPLSDFEKRLRKRESGAKAPRRTARD